MTDLEITKLCAQAAEIKCVVFETEKGPWCVLPNLDDYDPLHNDEQAMALVKKFKLSIADQTRGVYADEAAWSVWEYQESGQKHIAGFQNKDLNRAICECVAKMQTVKAQAVA